MPGQFAADYSSAQCTLCPIGRFGPEERFGAVARLEQERFTLSDTGQLIGEVPGLAGEHEGRHLTEQFERLIELARIGPGRLVLDGQVSPRAGCPGGSHSTSVVCREPGANSLFRGENDRSPRRGGGSGER